MVYIWQVDALERRVLTSFQVAGFARVMGAEIDLPDLDAERAAFDQWLVSAPRLSRVDSERRELMQALGIAG